MDYKKSVGYNFITYLIDIGFIRKHELTLSECLLLTSIYGWLFSRDKPRYVKEDDKVYFYLSQNHFYVSCSGLLSQITIKRAFGKFKDIGLIDSTKVKVESKIRKYYVSFDFSMLGESLNHNTDLGLRNLEELGEMKSELFLCDDSLKERKMSRSEIIVREVLQETGFFTTRLPTESRVYKTFSESILKVKAIYCGSFLKHYSINAEFDNRVRTKLEQCVGNWDKVKSVLLEAVESYKLFFDDSYMPYNKIKLTKSFDKWLYSFYINDELKQVGYSYFIQSLSGAVRKIEFINDKNGQIYFDKVSDEMKDGGNRIAERCEDYERNRGEFWKNMCKLEEFYNGVLSDVAGYWLQNKTQLITEFLEFCTNMNYTIIIHSIDIDRNSPIMWFLEKNFRRFKISVDYLNKK